MVFNALTTHRVKFIFMAFLLLSYGIILLIIIFKYMPCEENESAIPKELYISLIIFIGIGFASFIWLAAIRWKKMTKYQEKMMTENLLKDADDFLEKEKQNAEFINKSVNNNIDNAQIGITNITGTTSDKKSRSRSMPESSFKYAQIATDEENKKKIRENIENIENIEPRNYRRTVHTETVYDI